MSDIVITIPQIDPQMFEVLEAAQAQAFDSELAAVRAIREKFAVAAKHGQRIKTASYSCNNTQTHFFVNQEEWFRIDGKLAKGLLIVDDFAYTERGNGGRNTGRRLWLTAAGWVQQERVGEWSRFSGASDWWCAGDETPYMREDEGDSNYGGGLTRPASDEVASQYDLDEILKGLAKAITDSKDRVPKRIAKLQEQIAVAKGVAVALEQASA